MEADRADSASTILQGLQTMVTSLEGLQKQTEEMLPERQVKRPRREEATPMDATDAEATAAKGSSKGEDGRLSSTALEPFGGGRW